MSDGYGASARPAFGGYSASFDCPVCGRRVPARTAAELVGVNRNTAILCFHKLREVIAAKLVEDTPFPAGEAAVDESCFGGVRKGKRGRGAAGKVPVGETRMLTIMAAYEGQ